VRTAADAAGRRRLTFTWQEVIVRRVVLAFLAGIVVTSGAFAVKAAPPRKYINLPTRTVAGLPFSDAVLVGDTLYLAGRIGLDPKTRKPPATAEAEAKQVLDEIRQVLETAGMTMDDLVSVQVFCSDVSLFDTWNRVYPTYFKSAYPARAFLGSGPLLFGARFEVQGVAVRR
jgi:reactive intermediate/imine deaminase